ncbi:MAG: 1-deoxy-D-xylulose-5-phosphate synthase [Gammaproteobacteria bacterium]|nr:1-deoxy-D-xylulose-5-phosphate synthase [Gammaproteobacteria bacterium]MYH84321.1 1-deoxy-D-xylulose-5-phosphate synthase [Gammaproteobacteria bacterium]MYK04311.1 1-deoxy-D-xylulose-5-phosphate synthase [Gammaproteobacteria bacterium]
MLKEIPTKRPETPLLDTIDIPEDLRQLEPDQLPALAQELRAYLLYCVGKTGGHLGAGLGVVELTIALHYIFDTPADRLVWDVGHQAYPHKILTGRRDRMDTMRQAGGLAAFPARFESEYDTFGVGHSSTAISASLGMMVGRRMTGRDNHVVAVVGDGAMTAGMAFEAMNHCTHLDENILIVLNDNNMSISHNVGGLSNYFGRLWASKSYNFFRAGGMKVLARAPKMLRAAEQTEKYMKGMLSRGTVFDQLGFNYMGIIDGHNIAHLLEALGNIKNLEGPQLLHVVTHKGKGYSESESDPFGMHAIGKVAPLADSGRSPKSQAASSPTYSQVFGKWLCAAARRDEKLVAITPAMGEGSGMVEFSREFPDRFHDVAIAEQHAVTFGAGLACEGVKPVVAIYSTFLQRAYDQFIHDTALQNLDVLFAIDRAGLVGEDGPTHAGSFDLAYLRCVPNIIVMTPSDEEETRLLLCTGYDHHGPAAVRYPRGKGPGAEIGSDWKTVPIGEAVLRRKGRDVAILAFGSMLTPALVAAEEFDATVYDMRFVKPIDEKTISKAAGDHELVVTVEEHAIMGGAGSAVNEVLMRDGYRMPVLNLGLPDSFLEHGKPPDMLQKAGLDAAGIARAIHEKLAADNIRCRAI